MNDMSNFYDELDLKYPEIAIAMERIDRLNPGTIQFSIPVLTPNMDNSKTTNTVVHQNTLNLKNKNKYQFEIENINVSNYISIPIPTELCAPSFDKLTITGGHLQIGTLSDNETTITATLTRLEDSDIYRIRGKYSGNPYMSAVRGELKCELYEEDRYIEAGSKWIVIFIGGDITKPQIIGRYYE